MHLEHAAALWAYHHVVLDVIKLHQLGGFAKGEAGVAVGTGARRVHQHVVKVVAVTDDHDHSSFCVQ